MSFDRISTTRQISAMQDNNFSLAASISSFQERGGSSSMGDTFEHEDNSGTEGEWGSTEKQMGLMNTGKAGTPPAMPYYVINGSLSLTACFFPSDLMPNPPVRSPPRRDCF